MKYLAKLFPTETAKIISIWQVERFRKKCPGQWERRIFYSLVANHPMIAKFPQKAKWHFAFKPGVEKVRYGCGGEGVAHQLVKMILCEQKFLKISYHRKEYHLVFEYVEVEWKFVAAGGKKYFIDLVAEFLEPEGLAIKFCGRIGIEIKDRNEVSIAKQEALRGLDFGVIQVYVPPWLHVAHAENLSVKQLRLLHWKLKKNFEEVVKCKMLNGKWK